MKRKKFKRGQLKSLLEKKYQTALKKAKGVKVEYETATLTYVITKTYVPDFVVTNKEGHVKYIEVKGYFRLEDRIKMRAVKATNPTLDIRFLFDKDNKLSSKSKMTYSQWCDKYGFMWAVGDIPKDWLK